MRSALSWLEQLTRIPTTSGRETGVIEWVKRWVARRSDLELTQDAFGNLRITIRGKNPSDPVLAVAHMDHPGFVVETILDTAVQAVFRGGVLANYFAAAAVEFFDQWGAVHLGRVEEDLGGDRYRLRMDTIGPLMAGDLGRWHFRSSALGVRGDRLRAHACDDLAGVAAALVALDRARSKPELHHFGVLLTRAEEEGFIGAIAAAKSGAIPAHARLLSIEASRTLPNAPLGAGPIVRVGDLSSVFDQDLTNAVSEVARRSGFPYQRRLMDGGSCEATAFGAYGHRATGLCLALENYHNMRDIDGVKAGSASARLGPEEISISDFSGLIRLLLDCARHLDSTSHSLVDRLDRRFEANRDLLE